MQNPAQSDDTARTFKMSRHGRNHSPILFSAMLIVAPLNAQVAFTCSMIDSRFQDLPVTDQCLLRSVL